MIFVLKREASNFCKLEFIANRMFILLYYTGSILFLYFHDTSNLRVAGNGRGKGFPKSNVYRLGL